MIVVLVAMIVFGFCVVLHQLFKLQVVEGEALQARALQQQLRSERIGAKRGTIYDPTATRSPRARPSGRCASRRG